MKYFAFAFLVKFCALIEIIDAKSSPRFGYNQAELDPDYWNKLSETSLHEALKHEIINKKAKNVILFLGDGMGISTLTSARILKGQLNNSAGEESILTFEDFPYASLIKTYNVDHQVPDSAGTGTAFLCGVKTNLGVLGVSARVQRGERNCNSIEDNSIPSIMQWAIDSGKSTGVVTTTRITHATPGASYAHVSERDWEGFLPKTVSGNCKDIAQQLIEDKPGSEFKVILGGGRRSFINTTETDPTGKSGIRTDGQNLIKKWIEMKKESGLNSTAYEYVNSTSKLKNIDYNEIVYLFGLFNYTHMAYEEERDKSDNGEPSLEDMTEAAIKVLMKDDNGFVLLVEGGRIDHAHHDNQAKLSLYETLAFEKAVSKAMKMLPKNETLIVVTADHSHTLTINGYPDRGNPIFGVADKDSNSKPFTTLMYGNGPGFQRNRDDPSKVDTENLRYQQLSAVRLSSSAHGGEDVAVHSIGPMAHLFQGTKEQSYIAHVMAFAACIGQYQHEDHCHITKSESDSMHNNKALICFTLIFIFVRFLGEHTS